MMYTHTHTHLFIVRNLIIDLDISIGGHEVPIKEDTFSKDIVGAGLKLIGKSTPKELLKPLSVLSTDQTVLKHPTTFMAPQLE